MKFGFSASSDTSHMIRKTNISYIILKRFYPMNLVGFIKI